MKRTSVPWAAIALLAGCRQPALSDEQVRKIRTEQPYLTEACVEKMRWSGLESLDEEECIKRGPPVRWRGLFRDDFEAQIFCPEPARECPGEVSNVRAWLDLGSRPRVLRDVPPGGLYAIDFIGRSTSGGTPMIAYGDYQEDIVLDRLISLKRIEAPPPQPTKAELIAQMKKCEAAKTCKPNWVGINQIEE